jgi:hypothetical protein
MPEQQPREAPADEPKLAEPPQRREPLGQADEAPRAWQGYDVEVLTLLFDD